jgi:hypothetical protein
MRERPLSNVPKFALSLLVLAFCAQLAWHFTQPAVSAKAENLMPPPSLPTLRLAAFGEPIAFSKLSMLYLQAFDNQAGVQRAFQQLDYVQVEAWLARTIALDPQSQYPLFAASQLYAEVKDEPKQRRMLDFIYQQFLLDPNHRWKALAHAASLARHRLKDLPLAQKYAQAIRLHATAPEVPSWAKQMEIFLLEDMNELEHARILLGGLLQSGQIKDPHEFKFLEQRLIGLEKAQAAANQTRKQTPSPVTTP